MLVHTAFYKIIFHWYIWVGGGRSRTYYMLAFNLETIDSLLRSYMGYCGQVW